MAEAFIFVPALAGTAVLGFVFALFAANHYLTVLQTTAAGGKLIAWGGEPILDGFWKVFYLAWLGGLWAGPALLAARLAGATGFAAYAIPLLVVWVCLPISQLSSLSGPTIWLPLHPGVFDRLLQKPTVTLGFFFLSAAPIAAVGYGIAAVLRESGLFTLVLGCGAVVLGIYVYARLLGRLAFVLMFTKSRLTRKKKKEERDELPPVQTPPPAEPVAEEEGFRQPSELPPIQTPDEGPLAGYDVSFKDDRPKPRVRAESAEPEAAPKRKKKRKPDPDDEDVPYAVNAPDGEAIPEERIPASVVKPREDELRLLNRDDAPKKPKVAWNGEVLAFLGQPETFREGGMLLVMALLFAGLIRVCIEFNPSKG